MAEQQPLIMKGEVEYVNPATNKSKKEGQSFITAEIGIKVTEVVQYRPYVYNFAFQATLPSVLAQVEKANIGDTVEIMFGVKGFMRKNEKIQGTEKNPESKETFTSLEAYDVKITTSARTPSAPPAAQEAPTETVAEGVDDLPF